MHQLTMVVAAGGETCHSSSRFLDLWGLDSFCYLTGMGGAFNGGGELISVNAWAPDHWYMMVSTQVVGATITGEAGCLALAGGIGVCAQPTWCTGTHGRKGQPFVQLPNADQAFLCI